MKIKVSNIVPKNFIGITLWPFGIYVSDEKYLTDLRLINHERIHWEQQKELGGIFFYILYLTEWLIKLFIYGGASYLNLSSERECNLNEMNFKYLRQRKRYRWLKYILFKS